MTNTRPQIEEAITQELEEWGGKPRGINEGECMEFVNQLFHREDLADIRIERMETDDLPVQYIVEGEKDFKAEPYHVWITDGEFHYDAECPEGVKTWKELPFFQRTLGL